ncbi:MAG: hypothetical protein ACFB4I_13000 [Cyanophyceae cyanobacterium]
MAQTKKKLGKKRVGFKKNKVTLSPFEDFLHLAALVRIALRGRRVGAYLLTKGQGKSLRFVFGFECQGIHATPRSSETVETVFSNLESGLKELPGGELLTIHMGSFREERQRQAELASLVRHAPNLESKFLLTGERARVQELTRLGVRKEKFIRIYVTYTIETGNVGAQDAVEKILAQMQGVWHRYTGQREEMKQRQLQESFTLAFTDGFCRWEQILTNKMGLPLRPLDEQELWDGLWSRFNSSEPTPIPQLITLDSRGIAEEIRTKTHATTLLLRDHLPQASESWLKVKDRYVGALTFLEKPSGWANRLAQLRYVWNVMAREQVQDTEVFCQLAPANPKLVQIAVQRLLKQSIVTADLAEEKQSADVAAKVKAERSYEAQKQMYEGATPLYTGMTILVHRDRLSDLDEACRFLESCFQRPAWVTRELNYTWKIWLQTLPIVWERLLAVPYDRRQLYLSDEAPAFMPLVTTQSLDKQGFQLIADEGGAPIYIDLFTQHRNLALFATTRAGKSVLVADILKQALAHQMPIVAIDFPKPDGSSTFTDFTHFMAHNGAYFDISREFNNLFEKPDLRVLEPDEQESRFLDYRDFLEGALMTMVGGNSRDPLLGQTIRSLLNLALNAFFADSHIDQRYQAALEAGIGSPAWHNIPTLRDFLEFCSPQHLNLESISGNVNEALQQIILRLQFWLGSRVGRAISRPSSFPTNAQLIVFALTNLSNEEDAAILALSAYSAALRRALAAPASIFFIDEAPILFEFEEIASLVGRLCANGAKAGVRVILSAQDPDTIAKSQHSSKIFQNLSTRLIGRIQPAAVESFERILKYPREIVAKNAGESFFPSRSGIYSQWLLDIDGLYTYCRFYPAYVLLAAVANNPDEQIVRRWFLQHYEDKFIALTEFAKHLVNSIRNGQPLRIPQQAPQPLLDVSSELKSLNGAGSK